MPATRRRVLTSAAGALAVSGRATRAAGPSVTFAGPVGVFQDLYESAVLTPFRAANPDAKVFYYGVPTSAQALATMRRQRAQPQIDVVLLDLAAARLAALEELVEPLGADFAKDLAPAAAFPEVDGLALFSDALVLLYDPAFRAPAASWMALWNSPPERTIAIPGVPDPAGVAFTLVAAHIFGDGNDERAIESGANAIGDLNRRVLTWDPRPDVYNLIADGGARLGVGWNMRAQVMADRRPGRLGVAFAREGTINRIVTVNLVKGARRADAARRLIRYMLGEAAQKAMVETLYLGPVNTKARYAPAALNRTASTRDRAAAAMPVDWVAAEALRDVMIARWREAIPGMAL